MTRREEIAELLKQRPWTPKELVEYFGCTMAEIIEDLEHVRRSTQPPLMFRFKPPMCRNCGFLFKERSKMKPPSKCPRCRGEGIEEARYMIRQV
ncbi:transcriptional regulator [Candidatus Woesearchaeota archaeon]|nr:transcriptional regulator [Candidatus Woesearchaeota archaeon]